MAGTAMPYVKLQFFTDDGDPAAGHLLFVYESGTTTKATTYSNAALTVVNTNPIVLDASGRCSVFLAEAAYKFSLAEPTDTDPPTSPLWTVDGVQGLPDAVANIEVTGLAGETLAVNEVAYMSDGSGSLTAGDWYLADSDHNYASVDAPSIGFVTVGGTVGASVTIRTAGRIVLGGTLSKGAVYYVGATPGTLDASSTQVNRMPLAQADTTTSVIFPVQGTVSISIKHALATFAYSGAGSPASGAGNAAGGGDTELTAYEVSIPDNYLNTPGSCLVLEGLLVCAANTNTKTMKVSIGGSGLVTVFTNATNVANHRVPFRVTITRRTDVLAGVMGLFYYGAGSGGSPTVYLANSALTGDTVDWTVQQDLKVFLVGTADNDIWLTDYRVSQERSPYGTLV